MGTWNLIPDAEWLETEEAIAEAGQYLLNSSEVNAIAFDTETTGLNINTDVPLMLSLSDGHRRFACMTEPWLHHNWIEQALFRNPKVIKTGTNLKFDMHMLANVGVPVEGEVRDTLVMSWLHNENRFGHGLKDTARDYLGIKMLDFDEVFPMRKAIVRKKVVIQPADTAGDAIRRVLGDPLTRQKAIEYSGLDAFSSKKVHDHLEIQLREEEIFDDGTTMWDHFIQWETGFTKILWNMERRGMFVCTGHLREQMGPMERDMQRLLGDIAEKAKWPVNIGSVQQLRKLFFEQLGYKPVKMTDGGVSGNKQPSTDEEVLQVFKSNGCPYADMILNYRGLQKIYGTYIEGMLKWVDHGLRIHTTLKQGGTVTGRLSSAEPNLQNLPRPNTDKFKIREAFVASPGKCLVVADYDQLEMKLMAHFSGDLRMCQAIAEGKDLHCFTVSLMYGEDYDEVVKAKKTDKEHLTPRQVYLVNLRQSAKATGFGLIYGIGPKKLALQLTEELKRHVSIEEAKGLIRKYFGVFPGVEDFIKSTHYACQRTEFVQTLLGRKRRLPQINAKGGGGDTGEDSTGIQAEARRQSVNSIIQGTAADIAKGAMHRAEYDPGLMDLGAQMLLQIHDELIFEVDDEPEIIKATQKRVKQLMEYPFGENYKLNVPLTVGCGSGYTWADAK